MTFISVNARVTVDAADGPDGGAHRHAARKHLDAYRRTTLALQNWQKHDQKGLSCMAWNMLFSRQHILS
jgi:hypothetical protein